MSEDKPLTKLVREIALEEDTIALEDGTEVTMTKGEQLVRIMYGMALGAKPDRNIIKELYERMEGKVPTTSAKDTAGKATVADRVSEQGKRRLNNLATGEDDDRPRDIETPAENPISKYPSIVGLPKDRAKGTQAGDGKS